MEMNPFKVASPLGLHLSGGCTVASGLSIVKTLMRWSLLSQKVLEGSSLLLLEAPLETALERPSMK